MSCVNNDVKGNEKKREKEREREKKREREEGRMFQNSGILLRFIGFL